MQNPNTILLCDLYSEAMLNAYIDKNLSLTNLTAEIEQKIDILIKSGKDVLVKDMGAFINDFFMDSFKRLKSKYKPNIVFLIRHPIPTHISFQKMQDKLKESNQTPLEFAQFQEREEKYHKCWNVYNSLSGHVIISEDLQEDPDIVICEIFIYLGWEFKKEYLTFKPLIEEGIPEFFPFIDWYTDCITSTSFRKGIVDFSDVKFQEDWIHKKIDASMDFYNLFKGERKYKKQ